MRHSTRSADLPLALGKGRPHVPDSAISVIRETLHQDHNTPGTKALVAQGLIILSHPGSRFINRFFNHVGWHLVFFCSFYQGPQ